MINFKAIGLITLAAACLVLGTANTPAESDGATKSITIIRAKPAPQLTAQETAAGCMPIATGMDLDNIRNDLSGNYCLTSDVDLGSVENWNPIGNTDSYTPFKGTLDGQGHVIRNLTISNVPGSNGYAGLFSELEGAVIKNLGLVDVTMDSIYLPGQVGAIAGAAREGALIMRCFATGRMVNRLSANGGMGGLVSLLDSTAEITNSYADMVVQRKVDSYADSWTPGVGGLVGSSGGLISNSYATGPIIGTIAGGLVGKFGGGRITQSFATGSVDGTLAGGLVGLQKSSTISTYIVELFATGPVSGSRAGGLVGLKSTQNSKKARAFIVRSFAMGAIKGNGHSRIGGLVGLNVGGRITESYAAGAVSRLSGNKDYAGGLVGHGSAEITSRPSYWDTQTTGQSVSAIGTGRTTAQLQAVLPDGFDAAVWSITPGVTYPYLKGPARQFMSPLATMIVDNKLYTFLPIGQLEPSEYETTPNHPDQASKAAAYTMIAHAIGITDEVATLKDAKIDTYFWNDATQKTVWQGPITSYATIGGLVTIPSGVSLQETNVIDLLRARKVVIIRGRFKKPAGGNADHWMLATSFSTDDAGNVDKLFANDPWLGRQVRIDPTTKVVTAPPTYPLEGFTVTGYRVVTLALPSNSGRSLHQNLTEGH